MKIESKKLLAFVNKITLSGHIPTIQLNFTADKVTSRNVDLSNVCLVNGYLSKKAFDVYEPLGDIYIRDTGFFIRILKTFKNSVNVELKDNAYLEVSDAQRHFKVLLANDCSNAYTKDMPDYNLNEKQEIDKETLLQVKETMDLLKAMSVTIRTKDSRLYFLVGDTQFDNASVNMITDTKNVNVQVGDNFEKLVAVIDEKAVFNFGDKMPLFVKESVEDMEILTVIAPMVDANE